jgi:hypothetical protein
MESSYKMDREVSEVQAPAAFPLTMEEVFDSSTGLPNLKRLREHLQREGRLAPNAAEALISKAQALFQAEKNILELKYPITGKRLYVRSSSIYLP